jgi:pimeloyl-ACP methyl ester carboxylesterase
LPLKERVKVENVCFPILRKGEIFMKSLAKNSLGMVFGPVLAMWIMLTGCDTGAGVTNDDIIWKEKEFSQEARDFLAYPDRDPSIQYERLSINDEIEIIAAYIPGSSKMPLIFNIHGGGGRKEHEMWSLERFAQEGFFAIAPDVAAHGDSGKGPILNMDAWLETVGYIDTLIAYCRQERTYIDTDNFAVSGGSMGGTITLLYGIYGKHRAKVLCPEISSPDLTQILNGRANGIMYRGEFVEEMPAEEARAKAVELSPINHLERFYDLPMYARFGELDTENGSEGAVRFIAALKDAGQTIQELYIIENGGHGVMQDGTPFPEPGRMSAVEYMKSHMGLSKKRVWLINLTTASESDLHFQLEDTSTDNWRLIAGSKAVERNNREKEFPLFSVKEGTYDLSNIPWDGTGTYWARIFTWDQTDGSILYVLPVKSEFSKEVTKIDFQNFKKAGRITITDCGVLNGKEVDIFLYTQDKQALLDSISDLPRRYGWGFRGIVENSQYDDWLGLESAGYFWGFGSEETMDLTVGIATIEENPAWYVTTSKKAITVNTQLSFTDFEAVNY